MKLNMKNNAKTAVHDYNRTEVAANPEFSNKRKQRRRLIVTGVLILLAGLGIFIDESDFMGSSHTTVLQYLEVYSAFLPLLIYIVPFGIFVKQIGVKCEMNSWELLTAVFCGALIPSAFAGEVNGGLDDLMKSMMGHSYSEAWLGSLEAGIAEELLKLGATALLLYVWKRKSFRQYLLTGMCVGMGFQIEEDISYITESGFKNVNDAFPTALDRISGALGSHWCYAAVTAAGLYLIVRASGKNHRRKGLGWILLVMADHFLYDSPIGDINLFNAILTAAIVLPVVVFFRNPEMYTAGASETGGRGKMNSHTMVNIRRAEEKDIPALLGLLRQVLEIHAWIRPDIFAPGTTKYTVDELREMLKDDRRPVYVAADGLDRCVGYAFCQKREQPFSNNMVPFTSLFIDDLCVDQSARGRHVGEALFEHVKQEAKKMGCYEVTLNVWAGNTSAEKFYEKMGMKTKERQMEYIL